MPTLVPDEKDEPHFLAPPDGLEKWKVMTAEEINALITCRIMSFYDELERRGQVPPRANRPVSHCIRQERKLLSEPQEDHALRYA